MCPKTLCIFQFQVTKFCQFDLSDYIFGMINFYGATFYVAKHKFNHQGLKLQQIFIFIISGLHPLD